MDTVMKGAYEKKVKGMDYYMHYMGTVRMVYCALCKEGLWI